MANYDLNANKFLKNRLQFHAASRVGIQTGQALAQATNGDGHIVTHKSVWSAPESAFVKHTADDMKTTSDGIAATIDLVTVFKAGAHAYGEDLVTYPNEAKLPVNLAGKVFVNPAFPAVELYEAVEMTGVSGSNGAGQKFEAYEVLNGTSRVMNFIPPTAVSDNGLPVPGYTGRVEVLKGTTWTDLENCGDVAGAWALAEGNWEFVYMSGMVIFHPDYTPVGKSYTKVRFTGFKYIGETLDGSIEAIENKISGDISGDYNGSLADLNADIEAEASAREAADTALAGRATTLEGKVATLEGDATTAGSVAKAQADAQAYTDGKVTEINTALADKVDKNGTDRLMTAAEGTKLATYPEDYATVSASIAEKAVKSEVDTALAARYTKTEAETMVDGKINTALATIIDFKGQVNDMVELSAIETPKKGDVYNVKTTEKGTSAEYYFNGTEWEEFGTALDLSGYATGAELTAEETRAKGVEEGLRTDVDAAAAKAGANETAIGVLNGNADVAGSVDAKVKAEADRAKAAEEANAGNIAINTAAIATLNGDAETAGSVAKQVSDAVSAEETRAKGVEEGLRTDVDANTAAIGTLNGADTVEGSVAKQVKDAVAAEAAIARAAEQQNAGAITQEITDRQAADGELDTKITAETTRATGIESGLREELDEAKETIATINGDAETTGSFAKAVADEETRATGIESGLRTDVDANAAAITILNGNNTTAGSVAKAVKDAVDAEAALRVSGDETNATAISNEVARATGVEAGFETRIAANEAALEVLGSVDGGSIADALVGKVDKTTYTTDKAALEAADTALDGRVTITEGAIATLNGDATTAGSVAKQVADAVSAEAAIARAAEQQNATDIAALQTRAANLEAARSYEFVSVTTTKMLENKFYIVRNAQLNATLPTGADAVGKQIRIMLNDAAALLGGTITPTGEDTINGLTNAETGAALPFALDEAMDITLLYDADNNDWVVLAIMA